MWWFDISPPQITPRPDSPNRDPCRSHQHVSATLLARQLLDVLDDHLVPTRRLADEDTWIGPAARILRDDLHSLHRRLHVVVEDWLALDHPFAES